MKTNRIVSIFMVAALFCCGNVFAQQDSKDSRKKQPTPEERMEMKVNRMQRELMLDDETAAKFAPLYKEYLEAMKQCCPARKEMKQCEAPKGQMTDADLYKRMENCFAMQKKILETKESYYNKFKKILNARQLEQIFCKKHHPKMMMGKKGSCPFGDVKFRKGKDNKPSGNRHLHHKGPRNPQAPDAPQAPDNNKSNS